MPAPFDTEKLRSILKEIEDKRYRAVLKGFTYAHDDTHRSTELIAGAREFLTLAAFGSQGPHGPAPTDAERREDLLRAAQVIVATIEKIDRAQETYTQTIEDHRVARDGV